MDGGALLRVREWRENAISKNALCEHKRLQNLHCALHSRWLRIIKIINPRKHYANPALSSLQCFSSPWKPASTQSESEVDSER
jgi:hypothetical protein